MVGPIDTLDVRADIINWANLGTKTEELRNNFEAEQEKSADLINRFLDQPYFSWKESLIDELARRDPNISFEDIKDEWINLAVLYSNRMWDFKECINKINHTEIKNAFKKKLSEKIKAEIWTWDPYDDFDTECPIPWRDTGVVSYFQKIITYLKWKEWTANAKKTMEILKKIRINNEDLNSILPRSQRIPNWVGLKSSSVPEATRKAFDRLLSYEIWKEANRTVTMAKDISNKFGWLLTNTFPAINTIIWESEGFKYDESKLWPEYKTRLQEIKDDENLSEFQKNEKIQDLKWEYYIIYLKKQNEKIWNTLEQLYNNNFDYSKVDSTTLKYYLDKVADIRLKMLFDNWTNEVLKINFWNLDGFEKFYKDLADPTKWEICLEDVGITWAPTLRIPVQKKIVEWENSRLKDINQFWKHSKKSFDTLPIEFTINRSDIDNNPNLELEDKTKLSNFLARYYQWNWDKYVINGENVWSLIYLYFIINSKTPIYKLDHEEQSKIQQLFWQPKNHENNPNEDNSNENIEWKEYMTPKDFKNKIEKCWPGKFENWSEIWLPVWDSQLPGWWYQWMKIKLDDIDMQKWTFKCSTYWWELEFEEDEGRSQKFDMNKDFFERLNKISKDPDKIWLQPNPDNSNFNSFVSSLNKKLWTSNLSFPIEWITWDNDKFTQKIIDKDWKEKEVEIKYFWTNSDDKATYKIKYNPSKKCFKVSTSYNWEKKRFYTEREMDWNNFLIFFTQKWLHPQTEEQANEAIQRQEHEFKIKNGRKRTLNWFSFNNIKNGFTDIFSTLQNKIKEYDKARTEKFKKIVEKPLLRTLSSIKLLPPSIRDAISKRQQELFNEANNEAWKMIEHYLSELQKDSQFADTFGEAPEELKEIWWNKSYKKFLEDLRKKSENNELEDDEIHRAAALLLANIEKWGSPYRWLTEYQNEWFWVKILLGKDHYQQFLIDKEKCINHLKRAWKEKDQIQDVLSKCEMEYIINNVTWANWNLPYFGSHEERWINWKKKYIANPSQLKLSTQFADKLKDCRDNRFTQSAVDKEFNGISHSSFDQAREDFYSRFKASRYPSAIGNLRKMIALTKNETQRAEMQKCFIIYMLSGVLDVYGRKDLRDDAEKWGKTMWFLPWMLAKETGNSEKVAELLKDFDPDFATKVTSYFRAWDIKNWKMNIENLISEVNERWGKDWKSMVTKMENFEKYSRNFRNKQFPLNSTLDKLQKNAKESGMENINNSILKNPYIANSWWLLSNANVARDRMSIRDGEFEWNDNDEKNNRKNFWNKIAIEVSTTPVNVENTKLLLKQYLDRFQISDKEKAYRWIKTAYENKEKIGQINQYKDKNGNWDDMGIISQKEIESIIRYTFQWRVMSEHFSGRKLPPEMVKALKAFQEKFREAFNLEILDGNKNPTIIQEIFGIWNVKKIETLNLWSWNLYNETVTWRRNILSNNENDLKNRIGNHFVTWNFINHDIANMESRLSNLPDGDYCKVTTNSLNSSKQNYRTKPQ